MSFFPHCYSINILSKSPHLKYSIFQTSAVFSQKCAFGLHYKRWSEHKQLLGPPYQEVHSIYLFTQFCVWTSHEILMFSVTLGVSSLSITFLLLRCLCLLSSNALCSDISLSSESLFLGNRRYIYT